MAAPRMQAIVQPNHDHLSRLEDSSTFNLNSYIEELENHFIVKALEKTENNKNKAAKLLGMNRTTLVERIKKRKIETSQEPN